MNNLRYLKKATLDFYYKHKLNVPHPMVIEIAEKQQRGLWGKDPEISLDDKLLQYVNVDNLIDNLKPNEQALSIKGLTAVSCMGHQKLTDWEIDIVFYNNVLMKQDIFSKRVLEIVTSREFIIGKNTYTLVQTWMPGKCKNEVLTKGHIMKDTELSQMSIENQNFNIPPFTYYTYDFLPIIPLYNKKDYDGEPIATWKVAEHKLWNLRIQEQELIKEIIKRATKVVGYVDISESRVQSWIRSRCSSDSDVTYQEMEQLVGDYYLRPYNQDSGRDSKDKDISNIIQMLTDDNNFINNKIAGIKYIKEDINRSIGFSNPQDMTGGSDKTVSEISFYREDTTTTFQLWANNRTAMGHQIFKLIARVINFHKGFEYILPKDYTFICKPNLEINSEALLNRKLREYAMGLCTHRDLLKTINQWDDDDYNVFVKEIGVGVIGARIEEYMKIAHDNTISDDIKLQYLSGGIIDIAQMRNNDEPVSEDEFDAEE